MKFLPLALLAFLTLVRWWTAARLPVVPSEAYLWMCSQRLDWAFFDGPGGTAAVIWATSSVLGDGAFGLRFAFPLFAVLATVAAFLFGRALFGPTAGLWAAVALNVPPIFQSAATHADSGMPALAFLLLAAWAFVRALDNTPRWWWLVAGLFLLLAAQFQTATILLAAGFVLVAALSRRHRAELRRPGLYQALGFALAGLIPVLRWNAVHDWPALAVGTLRTALTPNWPAILPTMETCAWQLSLPAVVVLGVAWSQLLREARQHVRPRIVLGLSAPLAAFWLFLTLHGNPAAPWVLFTASALIVATVIPPLLRTTGRRRLAAALLVITAAGTVLSEGFGWGARIHRDAPTDWKNVAGLIDPVISAVQPPDADPVFVIAPSPEATAALTYHLSRDARGRRPEVFLRESQDVSNQFGLWPRYDDFVVTDKPADEFFKNEGNVRNPYLGRSAIYLGEELPADLPQTIRSAFVAVTLQSELDLGGGRKLRVYLCSDYQTMPL